MLIEEAKMMLYEYEIPESSGCIFGIPAKAYDVLVNNDDLNAVVLYRLLHKQKNKDNVVELKQDYLARRIKISSPTIRKYLKNLERYGMIKSIRNYGQKVNTIHVLDLEFYKLLELRDEKQQLKYYGYSVREYEKAKAELEEQTT